MGNMLGGLRWTRLYAVNAAVSASFGGVSPSGARIVSVCANGRSGCRIFVRIGSMAFTAASTVAALDESMMPGKKTLSHYFGDDGVIIQKRARVRASGGSVQVTIAWRNL